MQIKGTTEACANRGEGGGSANKMTWKDKVKPQHQHMYSRIKKKRPILVRNAQHKYKNKQKKKQKRKTKKKTTCHLETADAYALQP